MAQGNDRHRGRHEERDVDVSLLAKLAVLVTIVAALALLAMYGLFVAVREREAGREPETSPFAARPAPFAGPRLQVDPPSDARAIFANEESILGSYGWIDRSAGAVRIPIARAMELVVERGLPHRAPGDEP